MEVYDHNTHSEERVRSFGSNPQPYEAVRLFGYSTPNSPLEKALFEGFRGGCDGQHQLPPMKRTWKYLGKPKERDVYQQGYELGLTLAGKLDGLRQLVFDLCSDYSTELPEELQESVDLICDTDKPDLRIKERERLLWKLYTLYRKDPLELPEPLRIAMDELPDSESLTSIRNTLPSELIK